MVSILAAKAYRNGLSSCADFDLKLMVSDFELVWKAQLDEGFMVPFVCLP